MANGDQTYNTQVNQLNKTFKYSIMKSLTTIFLCLTAIALILFFITEDKHNCKWKLCPYKGITKDKWKQSVINYVGIENEGTDSYYIDMLHLEYPQDEYEELENKLFTHTKK